MCGLTGVIFGKSKRSGKDLEDIRDIFTSMFIFSEVRGHHASGVASLDINGKQALYKLPAPPTKMFTKFGFEQIVDSISNQTTILMGHSRWKTVGSEFNNCNNQPIIAGSIIGTHNGTINNATNLFRTNKFKRNAEVDSEIIFRMADASMRDGCLNTFTFKNYLSTCLGSLSCVLVSKLDPTNIFIFKGNKPLSLYYSPRLKVIIYSSLEEHILDSIDKADDWKKLDIKENQMISTNFYDFTNVISESFSFKKVQPIKVLIDKTKPQRSMFMDF